MFSFIQKEGLIIEETGEYRDRFADTGVVYCTGRDTDSETGLRHGDESRADGFNGTGTAGRKSADDFARSLRRNTNRR